ncbi:MAG TPA: arylsulfatase [Pontiella sp.]
MKNLYFVFIGTAVATMLSIGVFAESATQPNVVIIIGDDVGFGDVGAYGSKLIPTPNIDQLAAEGIRFTDGHCAGSTCTPSRYSMLTGIHAFRTGVGIIPQKAPLCIPTDILTLPKLFKQAGYTTGVIGKWHLGLGNKDGIKNWNGDVKPGPLEIGFDYSYLLPVTNDRVPCVYLDGHRVVNLDPADPLFVTSKPVPPTEFDKSSGTIYPIGRDNVNAQTYYKADYQHASSVINGIARIGYQWGGKTALWNDETMADHFIEKTKAYIAANKDKPFFLYFASQDIHVPRAPHPRFQGKTSLGKRGDAMVQFDWSTGEIMKALEKHGLTENTIIIFSSDNGPVYDDGYDDGCLVRKSEAEVDNGHDGSGVYRGGKYQIYEGGSRVPFIIRWPARIKPGVSDAMVNQIDFIASFADLLNLKLPSNAARDSRNILKTFLGDNTESYTTMIEEFPHGLALRKGDWKYIAPYKNTWKNNRNHAAELYYLENDPGEMKNIINNHPERAEAMDLELKALKNSAAVRKADTPLIGP